MKNLKKLTGVLVVAILGFVMYVGGASAETVVDTFPTTTGTYKLNRNVYFDKVEIDGQNISIELDDQNELKGGQIILKNGATLEIYGTGDTNDGQTDFSVITVKLLDTEYNNTLTLRNIVADIDNTLLYGEYNRIQMTQVIKSTGESEYKTILNKTGNVNIASSEDFNKLSYLVNFNDNDFDKGTIYYKGHSIIKDYPKASFADKGQTVEFTLNAKEGNEIESVEIKDAYETKISYTKVDNKYTFTMPESGVHINVKYVDDVNSNNSTNNNDKTDNKDSAKTLNAKKKSSNPKTADTIATTLVITALSLAGLNLLMVIKKRLN